MALPAQHQKFSRTKKTLMAVCAILVVAVASWFIGGNRWFGTTVKWTELSVTSTGKVGFARLPPEETGITFQNSLRDEQSTANQLLNIGSGLAAGDFDNDGLCDLYFCGLDGPNVLYKNLGNWRFEDVTEKAGVGCPNKFCTGATFADIDGDGDLDLLVTAFGSFSCFLNEGNGKFTEVTSSAGLASTLTGTTAALADIDGDRDLDLYVANYRTTTLRDGESVTLENINGRPVIPTQLRDRVTFFNGALKEYGEPDALYRNDGKGHFTAVSWTDGSFRDEDGNALKGPPLDWGLTAMFRDMNNDGYPDIYVCNDYWTPDRIWINDGKGRFRAIDKLALRSTSASSMGVDFADIDGDGNTDFFVVDMLSRDHQRRMMQGEAFKPVPAQIGSIDNRPQINRNTLFLNRGDNTYAEIADLAGVAESEWSWSPVFLDVDLDGYPDIFITNGHARDVQDFDTINQIKSLKIGSVPEMQKTLLLYPRLSTSNIAFHNKGDLRFEEVAHAWGLDRDGISQGVAMADLDGDGDLDLIVNDFDTVSGIYRNESDAPRVAVRLKGAASNTQAIGAKVSLLGGAIPRQTQEVICGGRYESGSDPLVVFASGKSSGEMIIEVTWRNGRRSLVKNVNPNRLYEIEEAGSESAGASAGPSIDPMFKDVSESIRHSHHENEFDDFARQPLLPNRLSQLGPGVAWFDINGDGFDDLIIGSGKDGKLAVFLNDAKGNFSPLTSEATANPTGRDQTGLLVWKDDAGAGLLVGLANCEDGVAQVESAARFDYRSGSLSSADGIPGQASSTGPMAMADIDGDGDLDLFIGGRTIPGRYPQPASSMLFRNEGASFVMDAANSSKLNSIGLVTGAVFSDIDGDGDTDLILAMEWGPVAVYINDNGSFTDATKKLGLSQHSGWWNGVTVGDLNEDGRLDIIATNWGLNSKYRLDRSHPLRIYYDDFDGNGSLDVIEARYEAKLGKIVPEVGLDLLSSGMPSLKEKFPSYRQFGAAGIAEVFGSRIESAPSLSANTLAHTVFFNRGDHFEAISLLIEAQFAPAFGVAVADYDGDGHEDVFITQNFLASRLETPRIDAGRGLWMKGDGKGGLVAVPGQTSGVKVYGDARGCAVADYDRDGRVDLVVAQNGAATKLYRNVGAQPGLRVRLSGPAGNPNGVGATIRLMFGDRSGPAREAHAGSGYWSQDSAVQVMAAFEAPTRIWVRWPGGKITTSDVPADAREIAVAPDGSVTAVR